MTRNWFPSYFCSRSKDVFVLITDCSSSQARTDIYGGGINTSYLNALLSINQYLRSISGYPCKVNGHAYVVQKALYGLHQSGYDWKLELNQRFLYHGYQRSRVEPCLSYLFMETWSCISWSMLMTSWSWQIMLITRRTCWITWMKPIESKIKDYWPNILMSKWNGLI